MLSSPIRADRHLACCDEGRSFAESFFVLNRTAVAREQVYAALADWAVHLIDVHDSYGLGFPACQVCHAFGGPPQGGFTADRWAEEGRVHHVVHALDVEMQAQQNKG